MPMDWQFSRVDISEMKSQIERRIGHLKANKYFDLLTGFLNLKIGKPEFDKHCLDTIGNENVRLHNHLRSIIKNAFFITSPPKKSKIEDSLRAEKPNAYQRSSFQSLHQYLPLSTGKGRVDDDNVKDRLGLNRKGHSVVREDLVLKNQERQSPTELVSLGGRPPGSVGESEEINQTAARSPGINSRNVISAPLGVVMNNKLLHRPIYNRLTSAYQDKTRLNNCELPDTSSLRKRLEQKLETEGINVSIDCANLLNNSLDAYLKLLIKPCLGLAGSQSGNKHQRTGHVPTIRGLNGSYPFKRVQQPRSGSILAAMLDFQVAMVLNPSVLGYEWPVLLEKFGLQASRREINTGI